MAREKLACLVAVELVVFGCEFFHVFLLSTCRHEPKRKHQKHEKRTVTKTPQSVFTVPAFCIDTPSTESHFMQVSWLGPLRITCLPTASSFGFCRSDMLGSALPLQWRDRAGLAPASLLAGTSAPEHETFIYSTAKYCSTNRWLCKPSAYAISAMLRAT